VNKDTKDNLNGVAGQATLRALKETFAIVGKFLQEYGAKDRLQEQFWEFNITWSF
jgi:hypothetical protein